MLITRSWLIISLIIVLCGYTTMAAVTIFEPQEDDRSLLDMAAPNNAEEQSDVHFFDHIRNRRSPFPQRGWYGPPPYYGWGPRPRPRPPYGGYYGRPGGNYGGGVYYGGGGGYYGRPRRRPQRRRERERERDRDRDREYGNGSNSYSNADASASVSVTTAVVG